MHRRADLPVRLSAGLLAALLAACSGGGDGGDAAGAGPSDGDGDGGAPTISLAIAGPEGLTAGRPTLVSSARVGRTLFDYTYTVEATNGGMVALAGVTGTVTSAAASTLVTDGALAFGDLAPGTSTTSSDTFTIRQDRTAPLAAANLTITLAGTPPGPAEGVLLGGQPGDNALAALADMQPIPARAEDVVDRVILTRLDVAITAAATVGEVNAALASVGGGIAGMRAGLPVLVVAVPRQPDATALEALATGLAGRPGIRIAIPGLELVADAAPGAPANGEAAMRHLNDARFPAAWNLRRLAGPNCPSKPVVLVADYFARPIPGNSPYATFEGEVSGVDANGIGGGGSNPGASFHGYDVLTTLAAALDDHVPTGANPYPGCLDIRTVQVPGLSAAGVDLEIAIAASLPGTGKVVVNTSLGYFDCPDPCVPQEVSGDAFGLAFSAATVRAILAPVADRVLWAAAAGNEAVDDIATIYPGTGLAAYGSDYNAAAKADPDLSFAANAALWDPPPGCTEAPCFPTLTITGPQLDALQDHIADLGPAARTPAANVLVVGSTTPVANLPSAFSNPGADVGAVGEQIPTMGRTASQGFEVTQGTSFAAPQVAALAAYLWMISSDLRDTRPVSATKSAITGNVAGLANQIDAYAAVLSLDPAGDPDPATWHVRRTLLDADRSGSFTETDLAAFIARYFVPAALVDPVAPDSPDYSEYDLNGDGYTGGGLAAVSFDLDRNGSTQYGAAQLTQFDLQVAGERLALDERFVTDLDVLCYYSYSPLFQGDELERERLLANRCFAGSVVITPAATTLQPGATTQFAAEVRGTTDPRVAWSVPAGGGSIDQAGQFTAGDTPGEFRVRATSVVRPDLFGEATVTVGVATTAVILGQEGSARVENRCGGRVAAFEEIRNLTGTGPSTATVIRVPPDSFSGSADLTSPDPRNLSIATSAASYTTSAVTGGNTIATISASGEASGTISSATGAASCIGTGSTQQDQTAGSRFTVSAQFSIGPGPARYAISPTGSGGYDFPIVTIELCSAPSPLLCDSANRIYRFESRFGDVTGGRAGTLQPGIYTVSVSTLSGISRQAYLIITGGAGGSATVTTLGGFTLELTAP